MTKLIWGEFGERRFETGVDRGVLYLPGRDGVAWSGLTAVTETPTGGEATPFYVDGYKYANVASGEEYEARIEALSAPFEFYECDGTAEVSPGLFVGQQPRKSFSFSYRTLIGNDLDGLDHGYKIHIVYNALAEPAERTYASLNDSPEANILSWDITTLPPNIPGRRPTAHLIVDSRRVRPAVLAILEGYLYGSEGIPPRLPSPALLIQWLTDMDPPGHGMTWKGLKAPLSFLGLGQRSETSLDNLILNPRGRKGAVTSVAILQNFANNPNSEVSALPPYNSGLATTRTSEIVLPGRSFSTAVAYSSGVATRLGIANNSVSLPSGRGYASIMCYIPSTLAIRLNRIRLQFGTATTVYKEITADLPIDEWFKIDLDYVLDAPYNGSVFFAFETQPNGSSSNVLYFDNFMLTTMKTDYFDGGFWEGDPDFTPSWDGYANVSTSRLQAPQPLGWSINPSNGVWYYSSSQDAVGVLVTNPIGNSYNVYTPATLVENESFTFLIDVWSEDGEEFVANVYSSSGSGGSDWDLVNGRGLIRKLQSIKPDAPKNYVVNIRQPGLGRKFYYRAMNVPGDYTGPYFDAHSEPVVYMDQLVQPEWVGEEDKSPSRIFFQNRLPRSHKHGDLLLIDSKLWVQQNGVWQNYGTVPAFPS